MQGAAAGDGNGVTPPAEAPSNGWDRYDTAIAIVATCATIFVHPVHFMLSHPFWLDESWVAVLTRAPLGRLPRLSSSAPFGFVALLRLVPGTGLQRGRLVVLGFSALTVAAMYALTRVLAWKTRAIARFAATVAALVVMLAPLSLVRNDLKQYTCDGFCAVALLGLGAWAERTQHRKSLALFAIASIVAAPFSSTALFVTVALFAGLLASAVIARNSRRAVEVVLAGAATGAVLAAYFVAAVAPNLNDKLRAYWASQYLSGSPQHMLHVSWNRLARLSPYLGMPAVVFVVLFVLGLIVLVRLGAPALAVTVPVLWAEMAVMGRIQRYPFLDQRTSQFLLVSSLFVVAIGAVGLVGAVGRLAFLARPTTNRAGMAVVGLVLATLFTIGFVPYLEDLHIPAEDVRSETRAVAAQYHAGDVLLVDEAANFGFSYYWPHGHVTFHSDDSGQGFGARVAGVDAIYVPARSYAGVLAGLKSAEERWRHAAPGSRLFIVRTHLSSADISAWHRAFTALDIKPLVLRVGSDPLLEVDASRVGRT